MLHLITCHGRIMPLLPEPLLFFFILDVVNVLKMQGLNVPGIPLTQCVSPSPIQLQLEI